MLMRASVEAVVVVPWGSMDVSGVDGDVSSGQVMMYTVLKRWTFWA